RPKAPRHTRAAAGTEASAKHLRAKAGGASAATRASDAFHTLARALVTRVGREGAVERGRFVCVERAALGPLGLLRTSNGVVLAAGPTRFRDGASAPASTCATVKTWATSIAAPV